MVEASSISAMKVLTPRWAASPAPTLAKIASSTGSSITSAGTKEPEGGREGGRDGNTCLGG